LRILETNFGRDSGWYVERDGRCVAVLTDYKWEEMFWASYAVEWMSDDPQERDLLLSAGNLTFRNREFGEVAEAILARSAEEGRVLARGLYLIRRGPFFWERLILWWCWKSK
jgi:hypothetical protein